MLKGKGFYIWKIWLCEGGDPASIVRAAKAARLTHVAIKVADGIYPYNIHNGVDLVPPVVEALRMAGTEVVGWQYVYGNDPAGEASIAIERVKQLSLSHFVVNAEVEYKQAGKAEAAKGYMRILRAGVPDCRLGLSTYRFPSVHPEFPFAKFTPYLDFVMPQVYWMQAHNPRVQLVRCLKEYSGISGTLPIYPTGACFMEHGWKPTAAEVLEFLTACKEYKLSAANFWEWGNAAKYVQDGWNAAAQFEWGEAVSEPEPEPAGQQYAVLSPSLLIRSGPGRNFPQQGVLKAGDLICELEHKDVETWVRHKLGWSAEYSGGTQYLEKK